MIQPIIIIGMHRAGTSLTAQLLQKTGVFIGKDLDNNYESQFFVRLNRWAFRQTGANWDRPENMLFLDDYLTQQIAHNFKSQLKKRATRQYGKNPLPQKPHDMKLAWKDPRNTFCLPVWKSVFPDAKVVHIRRNPIDVARSLQKREQQFRKDFDSRKRTGIKKQFHEKFLTNKRIYSLSPRVLNIEEGIKLWKSYTAKALSVDAYHLVYEDLLDSPAESLRKLCKYLEINVTEQTITQAADAVNPQRRFAFLSESSLTEIYKNISDDPVVRAAGYGNLLS